MPAPRDQDPTHLAQGGVEVGDVLQRLGGQDQVEDSVGVGQTGQVLAADPVTTTPGSPLPDSRSRPMPGSA